MTAPPTTTPVPPSTELATPGSARRRRGWAVPAASAAIAAAAAAAVIFAGAPQVSTPTERPAAGTTPARPSVTDSTPGANPRQGGGPRPLTGDETQATLAAVATVMPPYWQIDPTPPAASPATYNPPECRPLAGETYLHPLQGTDVAQRSVTYRTEHDRLLANSSLTINLTSYPTPPPPTLFADAEQARSACPTFVGDPADGGDPVRFQVSAGTPPALGDQAWRVNLRLAIGSGMATLTAQTTTILIRAGHTLINISMFAGEEPIDENLLTRVLEHVTGTLATLR